MSADRGAFTTLYDTYAPALYGAIHKMLKCGPLSEDALQNTFIKIWLHRNSYNKDKGSLFTWMLNIAQYEAIDVLRSKQYRNSRVTTCFNGQEAGPTKCPFTALDKMDLHKHLFRLAPKDRVILELCFFRGFTCEEAARMLNIPCGTVKTRMQYSYKKLKAALL